MYMKSSFSKRKTGTCEAIPVRGQGHTLTRRVTPQMIDELITGRWLSFMTGHTVRSTEAARRGCPVSTGKDLQSQNATPKWPSPFASSGKTGWKVKVFRKCFCVRFLWRVLPPTLPRSPPPQNTPGVGGGEPALRLCLSSGPSERTPSPPVEKRSSNMQPAQNPGVGGAGDFEFCCQPRLAARGFHKGGDRCRPPLGAFPALGFCFCSRLSEIPHLCLKSPCPVSEFTANAPGRGGIFPHLGSLYFLVSYCWECD